MAETKIEWTSTVLPDGTRLPGFTFNPWEGCQHAGPGCENCYAEVRNARWNEGTAINWGPGAPRRRTSASNWRKPLKWDREARASGIRRKVFCASLADVFDNAVDHMWRIDLADLIIETPGLDWLLLTKRIGNADAYLRDMFPMAMPPNVWVGATVVNQEEYDRDRAKLEAIKARVLFYSIEPMLGPINLGTTNVDWVICGGESGPHARPMSIQWARSLRDQCTAAGAPFLFKQWGEWAPAGLRQSGTPGRFAFGDYDHDSARFIQTEYYPREFDRFGARCTLERVGKKAAGRLLDGIEHNGYPEVRR